MATLFPILASIPVTQSAPVMALYIFSRNLGYVSPSQISIHSRTLTDRLHSADLGGHRRQCDPTERAEEETTRQVPCSVPTGRRACLAFAAIPSIPMLDQLLKVEVRETFGEALKVVWQVVLGIAGVGFMSSLGMRQLQLHTNIDQDWGMEDIPIPIEGRLSLGLEEMVGRRSIATPGLLVVFSLISHLSGSFHTARL